MPWTLKTSTPKDIAKELEFNLKDKEDNARVLILGTDHPKGYMMRMSIKNPEAVAGIIYNHAIKTGEVSEALLMCDTLYKIAATARELIHKQIAKSKQNN